MALLDNEQLKGLSPFFGTALGRFTAKVVKKVFSLDVFVHVYEISGEDGSRGPDFAYNVCKNTGVEYQVSGLENLRAMSEGPFITISNHPYGGMDGIILVDLVGHLREGYKVIVNKFIAILEHMEPSFITVTPTGKKRTAASKDSIQGIKTTLQRLRDGYPVGIFPAGAVSNRKFFGGPIEDRPWQEAIVRVILKAGVPVVPIHFLDGNSHLFYRLGYFSHALRTMRLPKEVINKGGKTVRLAIGAPISVKEQKEHSSSIQAFGDFLRNRVYSTEPQGDFILRKDIVL